MGIGGGTPRESSAALASTMVDLHAAERPAHSADHALLKAQRRAGWRDGVIVGAGVALVAIVIALLLWLP